MSFNLMTVIQTMRPPFLTLSPICILLGLSPSIATDNSPSTLTITLLMIAGVCALVSVNMLNEYHDYTSGLDLKTRRTPFNGGSGALPNNPSMTTTVLFTGMTAPLITVAIGVYFIQRVGWPLVIIGGLGVLIIITYTRWLNRWPLLCLIAPGFSFGLLMVIGTHYIVINSQVAPPWLLGFITFCLINNLLLLNQYPDIDADQSVGRRTFPIAFGINASNNTYAVFSLMEYGLIVIAVLIGHIPTHGIFALTPILLSMIAYYGARKFGAGIGQHPQFLAANAAAANLTPLFLAASLIAGQ